MSIKRVEKDKKRSKNRHVKEPPTKLLSWLLNTYICMYFDAKGLIKFCAKHKITIEQFTLCYLAHTENHALTYEYAEKVRPFPTSLIDDLKKRDFIIDINVPGTGHTPDNLIVTDRFTDFLSITLGEKADELFYAFPSELSIGDRVFPGRTISPEELELAYHKKLNRSKSTHEEVMQALQEQMDNSTVGMGLKKWFETEQWKREDNTIDITNDL